MQKNYLPLSNIHNIVYAETSKISVYMVLDKLEIILLDLSCAIERIAPLGYVHVAVRVEEGDA